MRLGREARAAPGRPILFIRGILSAFNFGYAKGNFAYFFSGESRPSDKGGGGEGVGGGGHPDAEMSGGPGLKRTEFFGPSGLSLVQK